jgi:hypothetical protein
MGLVRSLSFFTWVLEYGAHVMTGKDRPDCNFPWNYYRQVARLPGPCGRTKLDHHELGSRV